MRSERAYYKILFNAFKKITPNYIIHNSMLSIVYVMGCLSLILMILEISFFSQENIFLYFQITIWIWLTIFFSTLADSYAESKISNHRFIKKHITKEEVKLLQSKNNIDSYQIVDRSTIHSGDLILVKGGDIIPFDGIIVKGESYVNEVKISGETEFILKSSGRKNNVLIAGSHLEGNDYIVLKVQFNKKISFYSRIKTLLKKINRNSLPSELALQRIILGLSILFMAVIFAIWSISKYSGLQIPLIYILGLVVVLLPTTIAGLQYSIIILGISKLNSENILVQDNNALDNVVDVDVMLLDKTGTITTGKREIIDFFPTIKLSDIECIKYLFLSSVNDSTYEGKSIKAYAKKLISEKDRLGFFNKDLYDSIAFNASQAISGGNYKNLEIRKGSINAIANYLEIKQKNFPKEVINICKKISKNGGTPLVCVVNKQIFGVIHLQDKFRKGIISQVKKLFDSGLNIILVTGDNELTSSYIAEKLGIKTIYYDATPEKKLQIVRKLQKDGHIVAMCGDGSNDVLALAQADIGLTFEDKILIDPIINNNVITKKHDLSIFLNLKNICKKITAKRGDLTVFSLSSDITKYFIIVPALFITAFPSLAVLNIMNFRSLEGVILASLMFNALIILFLIPIIFNGFNKIRSKYSAWKAILAYVFMGILSPLIGIKLLENLIYIIGIL